MLLLDDIDRFFSPFFDDASQTGPLSETTATGIARQLVSAMEFLHDNGVIHRDIKPANLLVAKGKRWTTYVEYEEVDIRSIVTIVEIETPSYFSTLLLSKRHDVATNERCRQNRNALMATSTRPVVGYIECNSSTHNLRPNLNVLDH